MSSVPKFDTGSFKGGKSRILEFYINNQLKLKACQVDFGTGLTLKAQQAMLPDMIKFWQSEPNGRAPNVRIQKSQPTQKSGKRAGWRLK